MILSFCRGELGYILVIEKIDGDVDSEDYAGEGKNLSEKHLILN